VSHLLGGVTPVAEWALAAGFIVVLTYLNYRGIRIAGTAAIALNVFLILPLVWLVVAGFTHARFDPFVPFRVLGQGSAAQFGACLALAMWLYSGYYEVSAAAEEIENPRRNIPLALLILSPLVIASYALPTLAGLLAVGGWENWTSGEFASMGRTLGGSVLSNWLFLGSVASQAVIFLAYLLWWSRLVWVMAEDGHLPSILRARHPRFGTPHRVLILYAIAYSAMAALSFEDILVPDLWITGASNLVLQASLVAARREDGEGGPKEEGFRVPGGRVGLWLNLALPTATWGFMLYFTADEHYLLGLAALLFGSVTWFLTRWWKGRRAVASP
jgi:APA family basic amino acid/polyamine antiporter